jgi:fructose-1,6-bisphosphatase/inositol monophosphatase family enzyme
MDRQILDSVGEILRRAAAEAVMPRFAALTPDQLEMKSPDEPVTIADREAETLISNSLRRLHPKARVVGEEACAANPKLMNNLDDGDVWIIDPIDGTRNFAAGQPPFAMMVALLRGGETIGSWILDPLTDQLAVAERGGGAWIDGRRLRSDLAMDGLHQLSGIVSQAFVPANKTGLVDVLQAAVGELMPTKRCAGHEYPLVATGVRQFALYWRTLVWDHAPGALILVEAGGTVTHLDGSAYHPAFTREGLLLASSTQIAAKLLTLTGEFAG